MCCRISGVHLAILFQLTQHHNAAAMMLPNHSPEVLYCVVQWTLSGYVATLTPVGLLSSDGGGGGWIHVAMRLSLSIYFNLNCKLCNVAWPYTLYISYGCTRYI